LPDVITGITINVHASARVELFTRQSTATIIELVVDFYQVTRWKVL